MLQDKVNESIKQVGVNFGKRLGKYLALLSLKSLKKSLKAIFSKIGEKTVNTPKQRNVKNLVKRNPRAGIYIEENLSKEQVKFIARELSKMKQDFVVEKSNNIVENSKDKFRLITTGGSKELIAHLKNKYETKAKNLNQKDNTSQEKLPFDVVLKNAKEKSKQQSKNQTPTPLRHKKISEPSK